jgi:hypothetical protein
MGTSGFGLEIGGVSRYSSTDSSNYGDLIWQYLIMHPGLVFIVFLERVVLVAHALHRRLFIFSQPAKYQFF